MPIEVLMPALSPTMKEGNLAKWLKKEGDKISSGEVIAEIETDKATMEVEAADEGILGKIIIKEGAENVAVNSCIALILEDGEDKSSLELYKASSGSGDNQDVKQDNEAIEVSAPKPCEPEIQEKNYEKAHILSSKTDILRASPLAKRIAKNEGVSLFNLSGTGPHGRIIKDDVVNFLKSGGAVRSGAVFRNPQEYIEKKNNNIRKVISRRLLESKQNVPHFYLSCELNITNLLEARKSINSAADHDQEGNPQYKISVNDLIIKATAMALAKVPDANSSWSENAILLYNNIDISVAVAIDDGLITPIIKNADQKDIKTISNEMRLLAKKAREGKLQPEDFQGGSFSISNLGMFGIDNFSAIINPPQSCILAVSRSVEKPIVDNGQIKIASMMNVTLSCDHRSVDGAVGAKLLSQLRTYIENPILMMI